MERTGSLGQGIISASIAAGPMFIASSSMAWLFLQLPNPIELRLDATVGIIFAMAPALIVGFIIGVVPNILGGTVMAMLGENIAIARIPLVWAIVGAAIGYGGAQLFGAWSTEPHLGFGLAATSALCARICCAWVKWG